MLVILSAGMLTALTASAMSQGQTAFADDKNKCKDNGDNNCNEKEQKLYQKNDCRNEDETKDDSSSSNSNEVSCSIFGLNQDKSGFCPLLDLDTTSGTGSGGSDSTSCSVTPTNNQQ
jgi:hypothetical protein